MAKVTQEVTICCGHKRCPRMRRFEDGALELVDEGQRIMLTADQADTLGSLLGGSPVEDLERQGKVTR